MKNYSSLVGTSISMPVKFTADAIRYLPNLNNAFDIKEWVWHIEIINGQQYCIVTDRQQLFQNKTS